MTLRTLFSSEAIPIGHLIFEFATPGIGYLVKNAGADFVIFDLEHSGFTFETAKLAIVSARAAGLPIVVRVPSHDAKDLSRACDIGADGVMVPVVRSAEQARSIVAAVKYAPEGRRGVGMLQMHDRYRAGAFADKARAANEAMVVIIQIESGDGADAADAIAAVPGVDCLWVGHMDLSCSLGTPGSFDTPQFQAAVDKVIAATKRHRKRAGRLAPTASECAALAATGFDCLALGTDTGVYQSALTQGIGALRKQLEDRRS
ncbi:MAG TPA: aldolase/citrate lyase family protein [Vicinamibacterales bacterium]|nr:aldolase/citrate lyase family protein [Vicinamibacterales bacterium]